MFETIVVLAVLLWLLGLVTSYTLGGLIHVLLFIAVLSVLFRVLNPTDRRRKGEDHA